MQSNSSTPENSNIDLVLFFDGVCNICNTAVNYILEHNPSGNIQFSSLQSTFAHNFLSQFDIDSLDLEHAILYKKGKIYRGAHAIFQLAPYLTGTRAVLLKIAGSLPRVLTTAIYSLVANSRYSIFGKQDTCRIPTSQEKSRFLE